jgi:hypothetical protein
LTVRTSKRFLNRRKVRNIVVARQAAAEVISDWEQLRMKTALGAKFGRKTRVVLHRPWWMPGRLYTVLLSSIVTEGEEGPA